LPTVEDLLKKKQIQIEFLENGGLEVLASWISHNPDQSFPLPQIIELVFDILEKLPIENRYLENS